jgi:hypothetical protein
MLSWRDPATHFKSPFDHWLLFMTALQVSDGDRSMAHIVRRQILYRRAQGSKPRRGH